MGSDYLARAGSEETKEEGVMKYTPMKIPCDLCIASFDYAMATMVPMYLHVHPSNIERARAVVATRDSTPNPALRRLPRVIVAIADESITNVNEWYLETSIGSSPP
jgi:hypothetical protein